MLEVQDLDLHYGAAQALKHVSLTAAPAQVTCVLGRNGVGKSSLMRGIVGHLKVSGSIRFDGKEVSGLAAGKIDISSEWSVKTGDRLVVRLDHEVAVALSYESPQWSQVELERRKHKAKDL